MKLKIQTSTLLKVLLAGGVVFSMSACASEVAPPDEPASTTAATDPSPTNAPEEPSADITCETDSDRGSSLDPDTVPAGLPDGFPGIGVPFYPDTTQIAAHGDVGEMYVLEYQTKDDTTAVNAFFVDSATANCWEVIDRSVNGTMTEHTLWIPGYSLVIAVAPDRADNKLTSIFYTLRMQQEP